MARDKKSMIGFDPLAWLDKEESESPGLKSQQDKSAKDALSGKKKSIAGKKNKKMIDVLGHSIDENALTKGYELAVDVIEEIIGDFYNELFSKYPNVKELFRNTDEQSQIEKLTTALDLVVQNLHDDAALHSSLEAIGKRHQQYGAQLEHYPVVVDLLLASFKNKLGRSWTKAISAEWRSLLGAVSETMYSVYADEPVETRDLTGPETIEDSNEADIEVSEPMSEDSSEKLDDTYANSMFQLQSVQDISKSQTLKNDLVMLTNDHDQIDIDGSLVERIDGSALQLLSALFIYAKKNNLVINWHDPSEALKKSAETIGVDKILELN